MIRKWMALNLTSVFIKMLFLELWNNVYPLRVDRLTNLCARHTKIHHFLSPVVNLLFWKLKFDSEKSTQQKSWTASWLAFEADWISYDVSVSNATKSGQENGVTNSIQLYSRLVGGLIILEIMLIEWKCSKYVTRLHSHDNERDVAIKIRQKTSKNLSSNFENRRPIYLAASLLSSHTFTDFLCKVCFVIDHPKTFYYSKRTQKCTIFSTFNAKCTFHRLFKVSWQNAILLAISFSFFV